MQKTLRLPGLTARIVVAAAVPPLLHGLLRAFAAGDNVPAACADVTYVWRRDGDALALTANGRRVRRDRTPAALVAALEGDLYRRTLVAAMRRRWLGLHAATLVAPGGAWAFVAASGVGKSTFALASLASVDDVRYAGDDAAFVVSTLPPRIRGVSRPIVMAHGDPRGRRLAHAAGARVTPYPWRDRRSGRRLGAQLSGDGRRVVRGVVPLAGIALLLAPRRDAPSVVVETLADAAACRQLWPHVHQRDAASFAALTRLVPRLPLVTVRPPWINASDAPPAAALQALWSELMQRVPRAGER